MIIDPVLVICGSALVILVLLLGFWVSIARTNSKVITGVGDDPTGALMKAVRAHGNSTEYAGALIGLFVLTGLVYQGRDLGLTVTILVIAITAARFVHALGFLTCKTLEKPHLFKALGAIVTYFGGLALSGMVIAKVV